MFRRGLIVVILCSFVQVLLTAQNHDSKYYNITEIELWDSTLVKEISKFIDFLEEGDKIWSALKYLKIQDSSKYGYFNLFVNRHVDLSSHIGPKTNLRVDFHL